MFQEPYATAKSPDEIEQLLRYLLQSYSALAGLVA